MYFWAVSLKKKSLIWNGTLISTLQTLGNLAGKKVYVPFLAPQKKIKPQKPSKWIMGYKLTLWIIEVVAQLSNLGSWKIPLHVFNKHGRKFPKCTRWANSIETTKVLLRLFYHACCLILWILGSQKCFRSIEHNGTKMVNLQRYLSGDWLLWTLKWNT